MADHNTLMGSTSREIEGGTVLIGGVVREVDSGMTLVGGVVRDIAFVKEVYTITISGSGAGYANVTIDGQTYNSSTTLSVLEGTEITFNIKSNNGAAYSYLYINEKLIDQVVNGSKTYSMAVPHDMTIQLTYQSTYNGVIRVSTAGLETRTVEITGSGYSGQVYVEIAGKTYTGATTLNASPGTQIKLYATNPRDINGSIYLNGTRVAYAKPATYNYTVTKNVTITMAYSSAVSSSKSRIDITEE